MSEELTLLVNRAGFKIVVDVQNDRIGPFNIVTISKGGKRTRRKARKYAEALYACAVARDVINE